MPTKHKSSRKNVSGKKHETRNRLILYISAISIGLPLLLANVYVQTHDSDVLGASTKVFPTGFQEQSNSTFQNKLTCGMCVKVVHGDGVIVLLSASKNASEWGAICLPKAALSTNATPTPKLSGTPTPKPSFKNMPYILCLQSSIKPSATPTPHPRPSITPKFGFGTRPTLRPTESPSH